MYTLWSDIVIVIGNKVIDPDPIVYSRNVAKVRMRISIKMFKTRNRFKNRKNKLFKIPQY